MPEYARRLAVVVKRTRTELDLTQEEVAEKSGTDVRTIITFEQGCGNPTLKTLYAAAVPQPDDHRVGGPSRHLCHHPCQRGSQ